MKLRLAHFEQPRNHPGGALNGTITASDTVQLEFIEGTIKVTKGSYPVRFYAVGPRDWWEPEMEKAPTSADKPTIAPPPVSMPVVTQPTSSAAPKPATTSAVTPQQNWKKRR